MHRVEQWAYCYQFNAPVNTNYYGRLLKVKYLAGKQAKYLAGKHNHRIDHLTILLCLAKDKVYDRLLKNEKGKSTRRITEINKYHLTAVNLMG